MHPACASPFVLLVAAAPLPGSILPTAPTPDVTPLPLQYPISPQCCTRKQQQQVCGYGQVRGYGYGYGYRYGNGAGMGWCGYGMVWYSVVRYCMVWYGMSSSSLPAHFRKRNSNTTANSKQQTATETYSYTCPCTCPYTSTRPVPLPLPLTTGCMSSPPLGVDLQAIISVGEAVSYCVITMWL